MTAAEPTFNQCPNVVLNIPEAVNVNEVLGTWFCIRKGPVLEEMLKVGTFDCITTTIWKEFKGPENEIQYLHHGRKDGKTHISKTYTFKLQPSGTEELYANNFATSKSVQLPDGGEFYMDIQEKLVETDNGKSWSLWAACIKKDGKDFTVVWSVKSRFPYMDPMVEQMVVKRAEKLGGVTASQLREISQIH